MDKAQVSYNLDYLNSIAGGDKNFTLDMIKTFIDTAPDFLKNLNTGLKSNNRDQLYQTVHKFIASMQFVGINPTLGKLKAFERQIQNNVDLKDKSAIVESIIEECNVAIDLLKKDYSI